MSLQLSFISNRERDGWLFTRAESGCLGVRSSFVVVVVVLGRLHCRVHGEVNSIPNLATNHRQ